MRGFCLLILLAVMVSLVWGQDRPCGAGQRCVSGAQCESFTAEKLEFTSLALGSQERGRQRDKLRSLVCNNQERKVCCEATIGPDSPSFIPSLSREECGLSGDSLAFVLGGENTHVGK